MDASQEDMNTIENQKSLSLLREKIGTANTNYEDGHLFKFLVARRGDPEKASIMFKKALAWRASMNVDSMPYSSCMITNHIRGYTSIPDQDFDVLSPGVPNGWSQFFNHLGGGCYHKADKEGFPLYIELFGRLDAKRIATCDPEKIMEFHICNLEFMIKKLMTALSKETNKMITKHTIIFDLEGLGFQHLNMKALNILKSLADVDQANYPELTHRLFIVNAPLIFTSIWSIIRMWLDKRTLEKVHILGSGDINILQYYIDEESLPQKYGGKCTCSHMRSGCLPSLKK